MKELTIEEKAKAYDKALGRAKAFYAKGAPDSLSLHLEEMFPVLKESEDDRIRKWIIDDIRYNLNNEPLNNSEYRKKAEKAISWLEKQGEPELSEDLGGYIVELSKQFPEVSFAKLSRIAVRVKNWIERQSEQSKEATYTHEVVTGNGNIKALVTEKVQRPKFKVGDNIRRKTPSSCDKDMQVARIEKDYYICNHIGKFSSEVVPFSKEPSYELIEQKPAYKVEPKFHEGEWVVLDCGEERCTLQIKEITEKTYVFNDGTRLDIVCKGSLHLWTIQDAKDGDVLYSTGCHEDCVFIFDKLDNWEFAEPNGERAVATGYCCLTFSGGNMKFGIGGPDSIEVDTVKPATKEQRDLLFIKMKEAGYEWDAEKKELKLKELANQEEAKPSSQETSEWSEEDEKMLNSFLHKAEVCDLLTNKEYRWIVNNLKSLKDRMELKKQKEN